MPRSAGPSQIESLAAANKVNLLHSSKTSEAHCWTTAQPCFPSLWRAFKHAFKHVNPPELLLHVVHRTSPGATDEHQPGEGAKRRLVLRLTWSQWLSPSTPRWRFLRATFGACQGFGSPTPNAPSAGVCLLPYGREPLSAWGLWIARALTDAVGTS